MSTFLLIAGLDPVELDENFNLVRQRINQAVTNTDRDGAEINDAKTKNRPLHKLSFKTAEGGRIAVVPDRIIGVGSDEAADGGEE